MVKPPALPPFFHSLSGYRDCISKTNFRQEYTLNDQQKQALRDVGVVLCYLHGSVAEGIARDDSDADIAVLFEQRPEDSIPATATILDALAGFLPEREKDIAILNEASPLLRQTVASGGMLLYARSPDDALRYQLQAMHEYEYSRHVVKLGQELVFNNAHV